MIVDRIVITFSEISSEYNRFYTCIQSNHYHKMKIARTKNPSGNVNEYINEYVNEYVNEYAVKVEPVLGLSR